MSLHKHQFAYLVLAAALLSCMAAYYLGSNLTPPSRPQQRKEHEVEGLVVAAESLDFGQVWEDHDFAWQLPIRNRTGADIKVLDFATSCGCVVDVAPRSLTIPAGLTATVTLRLNLNQRTGAEIGKPERPFAAEITPLLDRNRWPDQRGWRLHGTVKSRITIDVLALPFGDMPIHGQPPVTRTVVATAHVPAQRLEAVVDPSVASVEVRPGSDGAGTFELAIAPQPSLPPGPFKTRVAIDLVTPSGERLPGATLPIEGVMRPEVRPLPARVLFGSKSVGERAEAFVVLQAPDGVDLAVERIEVESPDVRVEPASVDGLPPGRTFRIIQRTTKKGCQASHVRFVVRKSGQKLVEVAVEVSYTGLAVPDPPPAPAKRGLP